ncbi:DUF4279 domain-containing protein [Lachnospiraceae bacterium OttesenSCG-928-J05]|nr:DUF4279 domain-containing protein [Lachnospiraceae bacterium OttesenSCG-928-J05]
MQSKDMPLISISFCMSSKSADLARITELLNLNPSKSRKKSEWPQASIDAGVACDLWKLETEQVTSVSVDSEFKRMTNLLEGEKEKIISLCKEYEMDVHFEVVVHTKTTKTPAIYLEKESIQFLASINADIGFDVYAYE